MRNRHINAARNVWDRAVTLMPRIEQFWFKYVYMEEMVGNLQGARVIFDRWMDWEPDDHAWTSYVRLEMRANQPDRARQVFKTMVCRMCFCLSSALPETSAAHGLHQAPATWMTRCVTPRAYTLRHAVVAAVSPDRVSQLQLGAVEQPRSRAVW